MTRRERDTANTVRVATLDDLDRIAAIERACFDPPWPRALLEPELHGDALVLLAEPVGGSVGYALFRVLTPVAELLRVAVLERHRRAGIARALLSLAAHELESRGIEEIFLEVRAANHAAIGLYHGLGYAEVSRRRAYYPDGEDAVILRRRLEGPSQAPGDGFP